MMRAVVLAAGLGRRLRPLTDTLAKPAVPVAGQALVVRVLEWLRREGVTETVVNLHHLPATVTAVLGDGSQLGLQVRYSWEPVILGSAGGPKQALALWPNLEDPFLVVNGDTLTDLSIGPLWSSHAAARAEGALVTMAVVPNTRPDHYNGLRLDPEGRVLAFVPKGHTEETWHFIGVQVVEPPLFDRVPAGLPSETVAGLYRDLVAARPGTIRAHRADAMFLDVGTPADYLDACLYLDAGASGGVIIEPPRTADEIPAKVDPSAVLRECVVWPGAVVAPGVRLERCVVLARETVSGHRG